MQSGELIVTGKDEARIALYSYPDKVEVEFVGQPVVVPCNHHHRDKLEFEVVRSFHHHGGYSLLIKWHVTDVREIKWTVYY